MTAEPLTWRHLAEYIDAAALGGFDLDTKLTIALGALPPADVAFAQVRWHTPANTVRPYSTKEDADDPNARPVLLFTLVDAR